MSGGAGVVGRGGGSGGGGNALGIKGVADVGDARWVKGGNRKVVFEAKGSGVEVV